MPTPAPPASAPFDGSFTRLHLDFTLLNAFESPSFDEATALSLDALAFSQFSQLFPLSQETSAPAPAPLPPRVRTAPRTRSQTNANAPSKQPQTKSSEPSMTTNAPSHLKPSTDLPPEMRCRYRVDKCPNVRTLKKNGNLHSYCELHRERSIVNQRRFDRKKREAIMKRCGCSRAAAKRAKKSVVIKPEPIDDFNV